MTNTELTNNILQDLQSVKENLLELSDNIWLEADHNNNDSLDELVAFKKNYNNLMAQFSELSTNIASSISQYIDINVDDTTVIEDPNLGDTEQGRIIEELDRTQPHYLTENFTYKRPCAVKVFDKWHINANTWKSITLAVTRYFYDNDKEKFLSIIDNEVFMGRDDLNCVFSYNKNALRSPAEIRDSLFIETNRSANDLIKVIKKILSVMNISEGNILVYLREDRDAEN